MAQLTTKLKAERIQQKLEAPGGRDPLEAERRERRLAALPGWELSRNGSALRHVYEMPTIRAAGLLADLAAEIGASVGHHPAIRLHGRRVTLVVGDHREEGVTDLDFDLAELFDLGQPG